VYHLMTGAAEFHHPHSRQVCSTAALRQNA
jgi:hypothetical protein